MKNIAIITGASSGFGKEFVKLLIKDETLDEIHVLARREERLEELKNEYGEKIFRNELTVGLEPLNTEKQFEGESEEFGLTAQDYIINDSVRKVSITSDGEITKLRVDFYDDHLTTPEEFDLVQLEIEKRKKNFKMVLKPVTGYLSRYRRLVTSASTGAIFED